MTYRQNSNDRKPNTNTIANPIKNFFIYTPLSSDSQTDCV